MSESVTLTAPSVHCRLPNRLHGQVIVMGTVEEALGGETVDFNARKILCAQADWPQAKEDKKKHSSRHGTFPQRLYRRFCSLTLTQAETDENAETEVVVQFAPLPKRTRIKLDKGQFGNDFQPMTSNCWTG